MPYNTRNILRDASALPIPQYFNQRVDGYEPAYGDGGALTISSMQRKWRDDFPGSAMDTNNWQVVQTGSGHTVQVSGSALQMLTGTTINTGTIIRSTAMYTIPFRVMFIFYLSQRIANQEFYLEVTDDAGTMLAQWLLDGTTATIGKHNSANASIAGTATAVTITTTASYAIAELELFPDEVYYHSRGADSSAVRTLSAVRSRLIPDPNELYFVQIRARNLATAPASSTTLFIDAVTVQDIAELTAEITAGRGSVVGSQAIAVQAVGGTIGTVSTVSTVSTVTAAQIHANGLWYQDTVTNLGAAATFTGTGRDGASTTAQPYNRFRVCVMHSAGLTPGHLQIQQAFDGTPTWRETHRIPVPSDGLYHTFEFPFIGRQWRVLFINGATAQTGMFIGSAWVRIDGAVDITKNLTFVHSTTALAASASFTGATLDLGSNHAFNLHRALVFANQTGTLYLEQSRDGSTWYATTTQAVVANTPVIIEERIVARYIRVRYLNGATLQGSFELQSSLITL